MTERPIIFSGPMVRAILEGRKTQTRRVVKHQKHPYGHWLSPDEIALEVRGGTGAIRSPYGRPGDKLWARETWAEIDGHKHWPSGIVFRADMLQIPRQRDPEIRAIFAHRCPLPTGDIKWRPSIYMPRWASRITLRITDVRVEQLQEISRADARDEGCLPADFATGRQTFDPKWGSYILHFRNIWDSINARRGHGWETNPWVWVVEFERVGKQP